MGYTVIIKTDSGEVELHAKTFEEAVRAHYEFEMENIFERFIENTKIYRDGDKFLMYDSAHSYTLNDYELFSLDEWAELDHLYHKGDTEEKSTVYIDVDGTLAYWYKDGKGLSYPEEILDPKNHYYRNLEPHRFIVDVAKELWSRGEDVCVLSATDRCCIPDRFEWIHENLPFLPEANIYLCPIGADKTKFCKCNAERSVLIDDYEKNLSEWKGSAIKSVNSVNSRSAVFKNILTYSAESKASPEDYQEYLEKVVDMIIGECRNLEKDAPDITIRSITGKKNQETVIFNVSEDFIKDLENFNKKSFASFEMCAYFDKKKDPVIVIEEMTPEQNVYDITHCIPSKYMEQIKELIAEKIPKSKLNELWENNFENHER